MRARHIEKAGQKGFTLLEVIIAVAMIGVITVLVSPSFKMMSNAQRKAYEQEQTLINQKIGRALIAHSEEEGLIPGFLPDPCMHYGSYQIYRVYSTTNCSVNDTLKPYLIQQGLNPSMIANDGTGNKNIRIYQRVPTVSQWAYFDGRKTERVLLTYDIGVIYTTNCGESQPCGKVITGGVPQRSVPVFSNETAATAGAGKLFESNLSTWKPGTQDVGVTYITTLPQQKKNLEKTVKNLETIIEAFKRYAKPRLAANPELIPYPLTLSMARLPEDPTMNQGCREGWYGLDSVNIDIINQLGFPNQETGRTAWGASIEFCRDYDPSGTSNYGEPPHLGALRIHRSVGIEQYPDHDPDNSINNIVISF